MSNITDITTNTTYNARQTAQRLSALPKRDVYVARIQQVRELRGMSRAKLAQATGIATSAIKAFESDVATPDTLQLDKIALVTGFPPAWFKTPYESGFMSIENTSLLWHDEKESEV